MQPKRLAKLTCAALTVCAALGFTASAASASALQGAGSTLVAPIEAEWAVAWSRATGNPQPVYQSVGSGTGLKDIAANLVDFGASDAPLSASTTACNSCFQIPWALTGVGITYNVPGLRGLHLTGPVLAAIYLGQITNWSDPRIRALNHRKHLPNLRITPVHRADGSGDSYAFTDYLSRVSGAFAHSIGRGTKPSFPVGPGGTGNSGMVTVTQGTPGAIAYVTVAYLIAKQMPAAAIKNARGRYEYPNLRNISNAASIVHGLPAGNEVHIVNPPRRAKIAYPISTFTYVIVHGSDPFGNGGQLKSFVSYALTSGQRFAPALDFVPLPRFIRNAGLHTLAFTH